MPGTAQVTNAVTETVPTTTPYPVRYPLTVTEEMDNRVQQLLAKQERGVTRNDLLRTAIRQYLDDQEDVIGSRRHFSKSLQNRLDQLEDKLLFYFNILIYLVAAGLAILIQVVTKDSQIQSTKLIKTAIKTTLEEGQLLNQKIQAVREELQS